MKRPTHRTTLEIDKECLQWYEANFPPKTLWLTLNSLFREFKESFEGDEAVNKFIDYKTPALKLKEKLTE